jgi:hypothetical protein
VFDVLKEGVPFFGIMPKLVAEDAKGIRGVAETTGDFMGGLALDEKGTQGFVLPVEGLFGAQEEACVGRWCYPIAMSDSHTYILLQSLRDVNIYYC